MSGTKNWQRFKSFWEKSCVIILTDFNIYNLISKKLDSFLEFAPRTGYFIIFVIIFYVARTKCKLQNEARFLLNGTTATTTTTESFRCCHFQGLLVPQHNSFLLPSLFHHKPTTAATTTTTTAAKIHRFPPLIKNSMTNQGNSSLRVSTILTI